jgi:outer membrane receptor protein involved in Fe transport
VKLETIRILGTAAALLVGAQTASAQEVDIEVPLLILDESAAGDGEGETDLDLANIVQTAAKGVTTVQEAPAIVTVLTTDDIEQRGTRNLEQLIDTVPGFMRLGALHHQFPFAMARGTVQAFLYMRDGVSMFDPFLNVPTISRIAPIETIKRVETISGPGGVLWGANSFLGIMNVISKTAEDVDGVEAGFSLGHGNGDRELARGYVMAGIPELWSNDSSLLLHTSFETYVGAGVELPVHLYSTPLPQPNSQLIYGPLVTADPERSFLFNFNGKLSVGNLDLSFSAPLVERHTPTGFPGFIAQKDHPEDTYIDPTTGELACPQGEPFDLSYEGPNGTQTCVDRDRRARANRIDFFDRYLIADYKTRLAGDKAGVNLKGYLVQFVRSFPQLGILAPTPGLVPGGIAFGFDATNYRAGGSYDGDLEVSKDIRVLYGAEGFHEWYFNNNERSRQGEGLAAEFIGPYQLERLPLPCPRRLNDQGSPEFIEGCPLTFGFPADRTTFGAYLNPQWRPGKKLILDAGARAQVSPEALGTLSYEPQFLFSGTAVYNFLPAWHAKINYAQGFRPPVFNNLISNGEAVQLDGSEDLEVEHSDAYQAEINARVFKGERRIRELNFRLDYSYTTMENLIQINRGRYFNSDDRAAHSVEFLGKLYFTGGHRVELSYTWLRINMADKGAFRTMPEHWYNLAGIFNLIDDKLLFSTNLRVAGAMEDANRLIEYRGYTMDETGRVIGPNGMPQDIYSQPHELVMDRLPASADLTAGVIYQAMEKLQLSAWAYNAFNGRFYQSDTFHDYEPRLEFLPNPSEDFRFVVNATAQY